MGWMLNRYFLDGLDLIYQFFEMILNLDYPKHFRACLKFKFRNFNTKGHFKELVFKYSRDKS